MSLRVAALYDVHGNLPALEAVLADVERAGVDLIVFGGDVAAIGPFPLETIDLLRSLPNARFVMGNADREDLPELTGERHAFVAVFEPRVSLEVEGLGPTLFCHGSPRSDEEIVTRATPDEAVAEMVEGVEERVVVLGHTHMQFDRRVGRHRVVNAGSVGMPYEAQPGAYWALLGPDVELRRTGYDLEAAAARMRATGAPQVEEFVAENVLTVPTAEEAIEVFERQAGRAVRVP
jgi:predicted phosphodiesterase